GDQVLKEVARRISESLREVDVAARFGGEEFAILLPHTSKTDAAVVAARLGAKKRPQDFRFGAEQIQVTITLAAAANAAVKTDNGEDLVKAADVALYEAKHAGRDRFVVFNDGTSLPPGALSSPPMPFPASLPPPEGPFQINVEPAKKGRT